jgi:hypothetical protein
MGLELNVTHQFLPNIDNVNLLADNTSIRKKIARYMYPSDASKEVCLEVET